MQSDKKLYISTVNESKDSGIKSESGKSQQSVSQRTGNNEMENDHRHKPRDLRQRGHGACL